MESLLHAIAILVMVPWVVAGEHHHFDIWIGDLATIGIDSFTRFQNGINPTCYWNGAAGAFKVIVIENGFLAFI